MKSPEELLSCCFLNLFMNMISGGGNSIAALLCACNSRKQHLCSLCPFLQEVAQLQDSRVAAEQAASGAAPAPPKSMYTEDRVKKREGHITDTAPSRWAQPPRSTQVALVQIKARENHLHVFTLPG